MSMELSNQKKLSEFYEELKRMNIKIVRPDINQCFADLVWASMSVFWTVGFFMKTWPFGDIWCRICSTISESCLTVSLLSLIDRDLRISY